VRRYILLPILLIVQFQGAGAQSLDIALGGYGLSIGNSKRFTGIRINAVDRHVECINGLNVTFWNPGENPAAEYRGLAVAVIGTKSRTINGIALSGIGVNAHDHMRGIAAGALGVGAGSLAGIAAGLVTLDIRQRVQGVTVAGLWTSDSERLDGVTVSAGGTFARNVRGATVGGVLALAGDGLSGLGLSTGGVFGSRQRGISVGGVAVGGKDLKGIFAAGLIVGANDLAGIACSPGVIGGERLDGLMLGGLGLGAVDRIRGIAVGSVLVFAPNVTGVAVGALNGIYIDRIDLEDFLHFKLANQRFTGLSIGLVNYTAELNGVQLGLFNYAGNNRRGLRLLPVVNLHL
jgi:hypothetical protein